MRASASQRFDLKGLKVIVDLVRVEAKAFHLATEFFHVDLAGRQVIAGLLDLGRSSLEGPFSCERPRR
jgi:hypothetical protein